MRPETLAMTGKVFGRLTVLEPYRKNRKTYLKCVCQCGNITNPTICSVRSGKAMSCGCIRMEKTRTHGLSRTKFHRAWGSMKCRCSSDHPEHYEYYKGRGITVCDRWLEFINFYDDMYESYLSHVKLYGEDNTTLERIDGNRGYSPSNCKWATKTQQVINRRKHKSNTSGYVGVHYIKATGKWKAVGYVQYKEIRLGNFDKIEDAIQARKKFEMERENYYDKPIY